MTVEGFNLNIVECKYTTANSAKTKADCFNLNIVECKFIIGNIIQYLFVGFNLNIVECKVSSIILSFFSNSMF